MWRPSYFKEGWFPFDELTYRHPDLWAPRSLGMQCGNEPMPNVKAKWSKMGSKLGRIYGRGWASITLRNVSRSSAMINNLTWPNTTTSKTIKSEGCTLTRGASLPSYVIDLRNFRGLETTKVVSEVVSRRFKRAGTKHLNTLISCHKSHSIKSEWEYPRDNIRSIILQAGIPAKLAG